MSIYNLKNSHQSAKEMFALFCVMLLCFLVFCYMDWRYLDIEFLSFTNSDERPQFLQLQKMYTGFVDIDVKQFFAFGFYNYGFFYYVLNLLVALPFIIADNYALQIYAPRVLNAAFSVANLWILYKIARIYLAPQASFLLLGNFIAMGAFWHLGYIFKPDVFQAFFVLLCAYFLLLDRGTLGRYYMFAWISLGLGIGLAKFQAILFVPMICASIFLYTPNALRNINAFLHALKRSIVAICGMTAIWILTNPYLLHPRGFRAWLSMFKGNLESNATNHGAYVQVSLSEKFFKVITLYYFETLVFVVLACAGIYCCAIALKWLFSQNPHTTKLTHQGFIDQHSFSVNFISDTTYIKSTIITFAPLATGFFVSLVYLLIFVNKTWEIYYLSTMVLGLTLTIPLALLCASFYYQFTRASRFAVEGGGQALSRASVLLLSLLFILQIIGGSTSGIYTKVFTKYHKSLESVRALDDELMMLLHPVIQDPRTIILSEYVDFSYLSLGLKPTQVYQAFSLEDSASFIYTEWASEPRTMPFVPKDFLILKNIKTRLKTTPRNENQQKAQKTFARLLDGSYPYKLIAQSEHFLLFANTDTEHSNIHTKTTATENRKN